MKRLQFLLTSATVSALIFGLVACTTSVQTTTYNALATVEATADTTYSNYVAQVIKGTIPTNSLPTVSQAYNTLHAAIAAAAAVDQAGTNALVPANLTAELTAFVQLVVTATQGH
jgi:hypothetical protein